MSNNKKTIPPPPKVTVPIPPQKVSVKNGQVPRMENPPPPPPKKSS